jgi:hypothetical protein
VTTDLLKLIALDKEDLEVLSAHLQDAVVCATDILWFPVEKRLVIGVNRFDWETALEGDHMYRRRRAALRFERVNALKSRHLQPSEPGKVLNLLTVDFSESDPPSGVITLMFSGDSALRLEVECLEAELTDLGPAWTTARCPDHPGDVAQIA